MKRKPTAKSLRAGQTLYYVGWDSQFRNREVRSIVVGSEKLPDPDPGCAFRVYPRWYIREAMQSHAPRMSYSRREVESWIKLHERERP